MPFDRQGSALPPKKRTKLISVPGDGVNLRVVLLSAAYGSVPDTKIEAASSIRSSSRSRLHRTVSSSYARTKEADLACVAEVGMGTESPRFVDGRHLAN